MMKNKLKKQKNIIITVIGLAVLIIVCTIGGYLLSNTNSKQNVSNMEYQGEVKNLISQIKDLEEAEGRLREVIKIQDAEKAGSIEKNRNSCGCEACDTWKEYNNTKLGFTMKYPKYTSVMTSTVCDNNDLNEEADGFDSINTMREQEVEQVGLQFKDSIYIVPKYYLSKTNKCHKILNTGNALGKDEKSEPTMFFPVVRNEEAVTKFLKDHWGKNCIITKKKESDQNGVYDIEFGDKDTGGFNPNIEEGCQSNGRVEIRYAPFKQRMMVWPIGQDCSIASGTVACADEEILKSFRFLK
jgi:hypothetical protein